jgi:hypothetical protein
MATPEALGNARTSTAPCFHDDRIWYREEGTNRLMVMLMGDPSKAFNFRDLKTLCTPVRVQGGRYLAFRDENNRLMLASTTPPFMHGQLGNAVCISAPAASGPYLYYQGPGNTLERYRIDRDEHELLVKENCICQPAATDSHPNSIWYLTPENPTKPESPWFDMCEYNPQTKETKRVSMQGDTPVLLVEPGGRFWCHSIGALRFSGLTTQRSGEIIKTLYAGPHADPAQPCLAPYGADKLYYLFMGDLYCIPVGRSITKDAGIHDTTRTKIVTGCATTPDVQPGFVLYGGTDKKIYKLAI